MNTTYKAIGFDLDNTLIDRDHAFLEYAKRFIDRYPDSGKPADANRLIEEILAADNHGRRDRDQFNRWMARRFPLLNMSPRDIWNDFTARILDHIEPSRPVIRLLADLQRRYPLFVITNGSGALQRGKLDKSGVARFFKIVFISGETGVAKPDPRMFEMAAEAVRLDPGEMLYVGDDPIRDMAGAAAAGMSICWISMNLPAPPGMPAPDHEIAAITDFKEIIAC
ncbi:MAG: HAD family hydrolase [Desulfobacterales bacterium]|nr:HAD family hydrolase [Desulfobacterales bacterium]